jgi:thiosulfate dehydrogenase [quinone] large subunit
VKRGARRGFDRARPDQAPRAVYSNGASGRAGQVPPRERGDPRRLTVAALALLPLRVFFGLTFVYAGLDKLLDPGFFDPESATSIQSQFAIFERASPLAPLVHLAEPLAVVLGVLIALGELAVGLGALSGLAFRLAALGGAAISFLFFLTASWSTHPYYFGNDLPYAFGWLTLALAGHGNLFVVRLARSPAATAQPADATRRGLMQVGVLAAITVLLGGGAALARFIRNERSPSDIGPGATPGPSSAPNASPGSTAAPSASPGSERSVAPSAVASAPAGIAVARISDVQSAGARRFTVPITAPAPLPAGDPGVVVALSDGTFAAYDALCTHQGCRVGYDKGSAVLFCPCHGAEFDPADHAAVLGGPAPTPLLELPLVVNAQDGTIALALS